MLTLAEGLVYNPEVRCLDPVHVLALDMKILGTHTFYIRGSHREKLSFASEPMTSSYDYDATRSFRECLDLTHLSISLSLSPKAASVSDHVMNVSFWSNVLLLSTVLFWFN